VWWVFSDPHRLFDTAGGVAAAAVRAVPGVALVAAVLVGLAGWLVAGRASGRCGRGAHACHYCDYRGTFVEDIAAHEAGHVVVAEKLGYKVLGARVWPGDGGVTWTENAHKPSWDQVRISAAGACGENLSRWLFTASINGAKSDPRSDAGKVHRLAPKLAAERGVPVKQVVKGAEAEATRILRANRGQWRKVRDTLVRDRVYGEEQW
jgi:hypothetical protein